MVRARIVGCHVHHERTSSAAVKEVDRNTFGPAHIGRQKCASEVWSQVDCGAIDHGWSENTWHLDADVWLSVYKSSASDSRMEECRLTVANDCSVDNEGQQCLLVCCSVVRQQSSGVVVADGHVGRTRCKSRANSGREGKSSEKHACGDIQESGEYEMYLLWLGEASAAKCWCKRVVLMRDGEKKEKNKQGVGGRSFIWTGTGRAKAARCLPSLPSQ